MAYTSGIFHIDLVNGSDAARTALTSCTASNPSGTITRINKTAHGLETGAVVDLTLFSTWLNNAFKITKVDADNFDLDATVWQTTADNSGTVTPRGGMNWADAWLTINSGATSARIQPGDEFRFAKTPDEVSLGQNATWTDGSQTVTLTSAVTKKIEDAISGWTAATNITLTTTTTRKLGATALVITPAAGFTTGKMCYATISGGGTQDFSAYQYVNLWFQSGGGLSYNAGDLRICLCSDTTGDTVVNALNFPATLASSSLIPLVLNYGSALGSNIQSVAIYAVVDPGTNPIRINNIFASNGNLSLKTLIGKTGDVLYNIQSIDGTTIKIDSNNTAATGRGYSGTTSTETLYYRVPFDVATTGTWATMNEAGDSLTAKSHYSFGWDTSSNTRNGTTLIGSTLVGSGVAIQCLAYVKVSYCVLARFSFMAAASMTDIDNCSFVGGGQAFSAGSLNGVLISNCKIYNNSSSTSISTEVTFLNCQFRNSGALGLSASACTRLISCTFANNATASIGFANGSLQYGTGTILCRKCSMLDSTEFNLSSTTSFYFAWSYDHDNTTGNHWGFTYGCTINWQTGTVHSSEPGAWKFSINQSLRTSFYPVPLKVAEVAVGANTLVTVKAWVKKDHATQVAAKLLVEGSDYSLDGISATSATKADDTSWEQLTITFTPTRAGVVPIFVQAWYVAGNSNVYVGSIEVTQA